MASAPPDLPQSIVLGEFTGVKNVVAAEKLKQRELEAAVNVDIDDAGQLRRRRGYTPIDLANYHSLITIAGVTLVVRDGMLGTLDDALQHTPLVNVGPERVAYTNVADTIYFSNAVTSGKIMNGNVVPWGTIERGVWVSPVIQPTETLGAISGRQLSATPNATELESYSGRIYMAVDNVLWFTELFLYDLLDRTRNFIQMESPITMLMAVTDGLYVGTMTQLIFLQGAAKTMKMSVTRNTMVIPGSCVRVPYNKAHPQARATTIPDGEGPMFMTTEGICLGTDGGSVYNLTQDHVVFPNAAYAAALYREDRGVNSYVAVADSGGTPGANARIGDFVEADVLRAADRVTQVNQRERLAFGDTLDVQVVEN